jgi:hypothetical protein
MQSICQINVCHIILVDFSLSINVVACFENSMFSDKVLSQQFIVDHQILGVLFIDSPSYLCNWCLSPLTLSVRIPIRLGVLDTILCDKVCQWLLEGHLFSPGTPVSSTNETGHHDIAEIFLIVVINTLILTLIFLSVKCLVFYLNFFLLSILCYIMMSISHIKIRDLYI